MVNKWALSALVVLELVDSDSEENNGQEKTIGENNWVIVLTLCKNTLKEETFAGRNFRGSEKPRNIYISRE